MRRGVVQVPLAVASLLVAACTSHSQPAARPQPPAARASAARASAAQASAVQAGAVTSNGCAGQPPVGPLPVWARGRLLPAGSAHAACDRRGRQHRGYLVGYPGRTALTFAAGHGQQDPLGIQDSVRRIESARHQGRARRQHAHGDHVRARRARTVDYQPAGAWLLDEGEGASRERTGRRVKGKVTLFGARAQVVVATRAGRGAVRVGERHMARALAEVPGMTLTVMAN